MSRVPRKIPCHCLNFMCKQATDNGYTCTDYLLIYFKQLTKIVPYVIGMGFLTTITPSINEMKLDKTADANLVFLEWQLTVLDYKMWASQTYVFLLIFPIFFLFVIEYYFEFNFHDYLATTTTTYSNILFVMTYYLEICFL